MYTPEEFVGLIETGYKNYERSDDLHNYLVSLVQTRDDLVTEQAGDDHVPHLTLKIPLKGSSESLIVELRRSW